VAEIESSFDSSLARMRACSHALSTDSLFSLLVDWRGCTGWIACFLEVAVLASRLLFCRTSDFDMKEV